MKNKISALIAIMFVSLFLLTACKPEGSISEPADNSDSELPAAETTEVPTEASAAYSCPIGSWDLTDFSAYMNSIQQNVSASGDMTMTSNDFTGASNITFNEDQTAVFSAQDFTQSFTLTTTAAGQTLEIPIILTINGTSTSDYSIEGDKITYSNQDAGDMVITVDTMGSISTLDQGLFGEPGSIKLYQYSCPDQDTLLLDVIAVENMDLAPLTLVRAK